MALKAPAYDIERAAADMWRHDNPDMSVFDCDAEMQNVYRLRTRVVIISLGLQPMDEGNDK